MAFQMHFAYYLVALFIVVAQSQTFTSGSSSSTAELTENGSGIAIKSLSDAVLESVGTSDAVLSVEGVADISHMDNGMLQIKSNLNVNKTTESTCPGLEDANSLTQTQLIERLTDPCRYDRLERPSVPDSECTNSTECPGVVYIRVYVYVMQSVESSDLKFSIHGLIQLRYMDPRLAFNKYAPNRPRAILGEAALRAQIWVPHIFLSNEHDSGVMGTDSKDILTSIAPDGTIIISSRIQATLYCWLDLKKFPFDEQRCSIIMESWMYNSSQLLLHWEERTPVTFDPKMRLTEYVLQSTWTNETIVNADLDDLRHGSLVGNYSSLSFTVHLTRESGYYMMDYFLPSMMIVAISWVSFWLQADQTPARTTLGTSTLLSFITLAGSQDSNLPKVSYIKISEVWFLGCTAFIFGSLVEFAFSNTIFRRHRSLELKKVNSRNIFKSTLTPNMNRRKLPEKKDDPPKNTKSVNKFLTIETPIIISDMDATVPTALTGDNISSNSSIEDSNNTNCNDKEEEEEKTWFTMTPQEVSLWLDRKARFVFPLAFIIFNAFFWTFVYCI